jgi:hypothetical protein
VLGGSAFEVVEIARSRGVPWPVPVATRLAILAGGALLIRRTSARRGWSAVHRFALGAAGVLVYCWWGFGVELSLHGASGLAAHGVLAAFAIALVAAAGQRVRAASGHSVAPLERATLAGLHADATAPSVP